MATRWCPTPEQRLILDRLYRNVTGTLRRPDTADHRYSLALWEDRGEERILLVPEPQARERQRLKRRLAEGQRILFQQHHQQPEPYQEGNNLNCPPANPPHLPPPAMELRFPSLVLSTPPPLPFLYPIPYLPPQVMIDQVANTMNPACNMECMQGIWMQEKNGEARTTTFVPPITLELFPTKNTGMKLGECNNSNSKSSSCPHSASLTYPRVCITVPNKILLEPSTAKYN